MKIGDSDIYCSPRRWSVCVKEDNIIVSLERFRFFEFGINFAYKCLQANQEILAWPDLVSIQAFSDFGYLLYLQTWSCDELSSLIQSCSSMHINQFGLVFFGGVGVVCWQCKSRTLSIGIQVGTYFLYNGCPVL